MLRSGKQVRRRSKVKAMEGAPTSYGAPRAFFVRRAQRRDCVPQRRPCAQRRDCVPQRRPCAQRRDCVPQRRPRAQRRAFACSRWARGLLIASCALGCVGASRGAFAQVGQYTPYGQPYAQPGPYAQPVPYGAPQAAPGYVPLGGNSNDFTTDRAHSWLVLRASGGVGVHFPPRSRPLTAAVIDATAGYRWAFAPRLSLAFEGGFSYDSEPRKGGMYGTLGVGPELYLHRFVQIGWDPKFVIGGAWSGLAVGVRNTIIVPLFMHVASFEIGHQYLRAGSDDRHELRVQVGFDVGGLAQLLITRTLAR